MATPTSPTSPTATPSIPTPAGITAAQITAVAADVYPMCSGSACPHGHYATCESGHSGSGLYDGCPLTTRLVAQLQANASGVVSPPDQLGGGQDPYWDTESITADITEAGGTAHVVLAQMGGAGAEMFDLLIIPSGTQLLADDIVCSGQDQASGDAYAPGWINRSTC